MPLYEYRCEAEGHRFEKIQSFSAPEQTECPKCGSLSHRLLSAPAIQFKGSGFYLTDYGKAGGAKAGAKEGGGSESKGSSEAKPSTDGAKSSAPAAAPSSAPASTPSSGSSGSSGSTGSST